MAAAPMGALSSFSSIWGNGATGGRSGFLGTSPQTNAAKGPTGAMRDMARMAGLCCPLTDDVMREPVVASDG